ncbi:Sec-independent protein translocase subunit TatA [Nocardiopsis changdeensis]|uniref:Sec-independent protein translocase protein TatA n=1 Tax=Nocardiopsis changdeensis TaxID=2831969 RepID=A0ABX8BF98_9ACTN|nr:MULTISPECIES: Sec-independent protein translocase subunit TatA [Nocardiopsis]QUX20915.1 Sec-independent protein translocase subunit TatA [Nocardiopsis changdeensis]QYX36846.1 Sec-independent protein translocase subunit TatA [Nocardiopsis sp. MT53]
MGIGAREILILLVIALLLFGAKKLPDLARSLGRSARILKAESKGLVENEDDQNQQAQQQPQAQQPQQQAAPQAQPQQPQTSYPQLPPGQRIVNEAGEPQPYNNQQ